jgi:HAD superfamily hydrolase (TIGR01549 family)
MVRAVLFDLDDTLFDHTGCSRDALAAAQDCHESLGGVALADLERVHSRLLEELHADVMLGKVPLDQARQERFRRLLVATGTTPDGDLVAETAAAYRDRYKSVRRAVCGAGELLAALSGRVRLGIVSNNLYDEQMEKLRVCGLDTFVDSVVVSERAGVSKPDPAIFSVALQELETDAQGAVMVGDSWKADIAGARAAGIQPIWFNPLRLDHPAGAEPVPELYALEPADAVAEFILSAR